MSPQIPMILFVLILSLAVHESAHAWAALRLGDDTAARMGRISLNPLVHLDPVGSVLVPLIAGLVGGAPFGWARPVPVDTRRLAHPVRDHAIVAAAGPGSNLLLALISAILLGLLTGWAHAGGGGDAVVFLSLLFSWGLRVNVILALFNLIPLPPLDGGRILRAGLRGRAAELFERLEAYGFLLVLLLVYGMGGIPGSIFLAVEGIFLTVVRGVSGLLA